MKRNLIISIFFAGLALSMVAGCGRQGCQTQKGETTRSLADMVPKDVQVAIFIPDTSMVLGQLKALKDKLGPQAEFLKDMTEDLEKLGFDPDNPSTLANIGLDPKGGLVVAGNKDWVFFVLTTKDGNRFEQYVKERSEKDTPGELEFQTVQEGGRSITLVTKAKDGELVYAQAQAGSRFLVVPGKNLDDGKVDAKALLTKILSLPKAQSLGAQAAYGQTEARLPKDASVRVWLDVPDLAAIALENIDGASDPKGKRTMERLKKAVLGTTAGLVMSSSGFRFVLESAIEEGQRKLMAQHFAAKRDFPDFAALTGKDVVLFVQAAFHPEKALKLLKDILPKDLERRLTQQLDAAKAAGVDMEADLTKAVSGHVAFAFYNLDMSTGLQGLMGGPNGFDSSLLDTTTLVQFRDSAKGQALMDRMMARMKLVGIEISTSKAGSLVVNEVKRNGLGLASWIVKRDLLAVATGAGRAQKVQDAFEGKTKATSLAAAPLSKGAKSALSKDKVVGLYLDFKNMVARFPILLMAAGKNAALIGKLQDFYGFAKVVPSLGLEVEIGITLVQ